MRALAQVETSDQTADIGRHEAAQAPDCKSIARARLDSIAAILERDVIPRLAQAHRPRSASRPSIAPYPDEDVEDFADAAISSDDGAPARIVERLLASGVPLDDIYLRLLAPAARYLGARWEDDTIDFTTVMSGVARLHGLVHALSRRFDTAPARDARRILLVANPGEHHAFGPLMVAEFFKRAGWDSRYEAGATSASIVKSIRADSLDALGLSCATERYLGGLERCIRAARRAACGRPLVVLVGGAAFVCKPELATMVGADGTAQDGPSAVTTADRLVPANRLLAV